MSILSSQAIIAFAAGSINILHIYSMLRDAVSSVKPGQLEFTEFLLQKNGTFWKAPQNYQWVLGQTIRRYMFLQLFSHLLKDCRVSNRENSFFYQTKVEEVSHTWMEAADRL